MSDLLSKLDGMGWEDLQNLGKELNCPELYISNKIFKERLRIKIRAKLVEDGMEELEVKSKPINSGSFEKKESKPQSSAFSSSTKRSPAKNKPKRSKKSPAPPVQPKVYNAQPQPTRPNTTVPQLSGVATRPKPKKKNNVWPPASSGESKQPQLPSKTGQKKIKKPKWKKVQSSTTSEVSTPPKQPPPVPANILANVRDEVKPHIPKRAPVSKPSESSSHFQQVRQEEAKVFKEQTTPSPVTSPSKVLPPSKVPVPSPSKMPVPPKRHHKANVPQRNSALLKGKAKPPPKPYNGAKPAQRSFKVSVPKGKPQPPPGQKIAPPPPAHKRTGGKKKKAPPPRPKGILGNATSMQSESNESETSGWCLPSSCVKANNSDVVSEIPEEKRSEYIPSVKKNRPKKKKPAGRPPPPSQEAPRAPSSVNSEVSHNSASTRNTRTHRKSRVTVFEPPRLHPCKIEIEKPCLDDFELLKEIGKGAFGKVYQVEHKRSGKIYAMKVLKKKNIIERNQVEHTKMEREVLRLSTHPFCVSLRFAFQTSKKLYLVMDFYRGGELFFHLQRVQRFPEKTVRLMLAEVTLAIGHLHNYNIIYRDLKPENILIDKDGHLALTDFGMTKQLKKGENTRTFCGTPEYLAPEVVLGKAYDKNVDWWSVGILCYELTIGIPPFYSAHSLKEMYKKIRSARLTWKKREKYLNRDLMDFVKLLLDRNPKRRLGTGVEDVEAVGSHPFFNSLNFDLVLERKYKPDFKPSFKGGDKDTSNFDKVKKPKETVYESFKEKDSSLFRDFTYRPDAILGGVV